MLTLLLDHGLDVSEGEALRLTELVGPVIESGYAADLAADLESVIARCPTGLVNSCLDWWFKVHTGRTASGTCYHPSEEVAGDFATAWAQLRDVTAPRPADWLEKRRLLDEEVAALAPGSEGPLTLDWYGTSKLPGERIAWAWLIETLRDSVVELQAGRPGPVPSYSESDFGNRLTMCGIIHGSRRWKEMLRRSDTLLANLATVREFALVAETFDGAVPGPTDIPDDVRDGLGSLADYLFAVLDEDWAGPSWESTAIAIDEYCDGLFEQDLALLTVRLEPWFAKWNTRRPALTHLDPPLRRLVALRADITAMQTAELSTEDVELAVMLGDFDEAERIVAETRQAQDEQLTSARLREDLQSGQRRLEAAGLDVPGEFDELTRLIDAGPSGETEVRVRGLIEASNRRIETVRTERRRAVAASHYETLRILRARANVLYDVDQSSTSEILSESRLGEIAQLVADLAEARANEVEITRQRIEQTLNEDVQSDQTLDELRARYTTIPRGDTPQERIAELDELEAYLVDLQRLVVSRWDQDRDGEGKLVDHIVAYCTSHMDFSETDVRRFYVAVKTKPFVILAGLTGSGKSSIVRLFAESIGATSASRQFRRVAVRPDWIDQSETLGFINPITKRFEPGWLAEVIRACLRQPDRLFFVLLDEMNLAPVEQYLAELLSAMEEQRAGFGGVTIPLYAAGAAPDNGSEWPPELGFPQNLIVVGTVNIDETTRPLSDRVVDRANMLQPEVLWSTRHHEVEDETGPAAEALDVTASAWQRLRTLTPSSRHHELLVAIAEHLADVGVGIGPRAHVEIERFLSNAQGVLDDGEALDLSLLQRVVPKIRGFKRDLIDTLTAVRELLEQTGCPRTADVLTGWLGPTVSENAWIDGTATRTRRNR